MNINILFLSTFQIKIVFGYINVKKLLISMINTIFISYWCRAFYFVLILRLFVYVFFCSSQFLMCYFCVDFTLSFYCLKLKQHRENFSHWLVYQDLRLPNTWKNFGNFYRNRKNAYYIFVTCLVITIIYCVFFFHFLRLLD